MKLSTIYYNAFTVKIPTMNYEPSTMSQHKFFSPDLQSVINTPMHIRRNHLHNPKVCLPLQPANELADCSVKVIKAKQKIKK